MTSLEKKEILAKESSRALDIASKILLVTTVIGTAAALARKQPEVAKSIGATGLIITAELKATGILFERASDMVGLRAEAEEDRSKQSLSILLKNPTA